MTDIRIGDLDLKLASVPGAKPFQPISLPTTQGEPGQEGVIIYPTAHLGFGESEYVTRGAYHYTENADAALPLEVLPGPLVTVIPVGGGLVRDFFDEGTNLYVLLGRFVKRIAASTLAVTTSKDFGAGNAPMSAAQWLAKHYIAIEPSQAFQELTTTPDGWTAGPKNATRLHVGPDRLWRADSDGSTKALVASCAADPMVGANWAAEETVGDKSVPITGLATLGVSLLVGKENGLFGFDTETETIQNLLEELAGFRHPDNGWALGIWSAQAWYNHTRGLYSYTPGVATPRGLETLPLNRSPVVGRVTAQLGAGINIYIAVYDGTDSYLLRGQDVGQRIAWHPIARLPGVRCYAIHLSRLWPNPRLLLGYGNDVAYIELSAGTPDQRQPEYRFAPSGSIFFGAAQLADPRLPILVREIEFETENTNPNHLWRPYIRMDGGKWVECPPAVRAGRVRVPVPLMRDAVGRKLELRLDYQNTTSTTPSRIKFPVAVRYVERPRFARAYELAVSLPEGQYFEALEYLASKLGEVLPCRLPNTKGDFQLIHAAFGQPVGALPHEATGAFLIRLKEA